ncbi:MAG: NADH-quinone oxidoreductase subunit N [Armatimonadota bacterium]|nr:NADH-quinone oxidoreductase subunit N [Armatimonadota bacterium]MDR7455017.1 NADH-quinone oxidoreductase subunit N [Armatimonadota bacterium]MDR7456567.1 NADH-quinone oxidoreductase subunit N [Armatimonadota bacterium]MDR7497354.1 NADH-quinone oxidoreductase subunit N [Armatimonadota bacterium]MDR7512568.1 NADH-quinone oxidoreductase subunit N [Armatimonadota bacterium]
MTSIPPVPLGLLAPELVVLAVAMVVLLADLWLPPARRGLLVVAAVAGAVAAAWLGLGLPDGVGFAGTYVRDGLTRAGQTLALAATALGLLVAPEYLRRGGLDRGEYYFLVLVAGLGAMLMAASRDLLLLFLALETLSVPLYVLAATGRGSVRSQEAGIKYFLLGAFASAFFLYGVALVYGTTGTTRLPEIGAAFSAQPVSASAAAGVGLLVIGLGFKAALVPFHTWAPDVYEGAPFPAAAFMSVVAKIGAFVALVRVFPMTLGALALHWSALLGALAVLTMVVGNLAALLQTSYKRMLAYSSIAHAGYLLVGVAVGTPQAVGAVITYLLVYAAMGTGAFAVAIALERGGAEADRIDDYAGLSARAPLLAVAGGLFMVSLAGLPPTGGFMAKLGVFLAAADAGLPGVILALVGFLTSVVSVYYYLRVAYVMFSPAPSAGVTPAQRSGVVHADATAIAPGSGTAGAAVRLHASPLLNLAVLVAAAAVIQTGILPSTVAALGAQVAALLR